MSTPGPRTRRRLAVIGGGWAGLAAAVRAVEAGWQVTLFEMAPMLGGRARSLAGDADAERIDNGQHILIGAYTRTLALMTTVGADPAQLLQRRPLELLQPDGTGLTMPHGPAWLVFAAAVARARGWDWRDKAALLRAALRWTVAGFRCPTSQTVAQLCAAMPRSLRARLIDPLCVAALNTPAEEASAQVFLRVLRDSLFGAPGSSDLLLPRAPLAALLPDPASRWLARQGAEVRLSSRVQTLACEAAGWVVDGTRFDATVLACTASEAARLVRSVSPAWADSAAAIAYEPIVTVLLQARGLELAAPMLALPDSADAPAQFIFDHGALGGPVGRFALVVSGAAPWVARGLEATAAAGLAQAAAAFAPGVWPSSATVIRTQAEKRATFRCVPGLIRPAATIASGLMAAGDYVDGPYPATLEAAVRSGEAAVAALARA